jgi:hypothetical protein
MLQTVSKNKYAIGYDGIGYADDKSVKMLTVNGVKADAKTARSGKYAVSRYLYVFTKGWPAATCSTSSTSAGDAGQKIVASRASCLFARARRRRGRGVPPEYGCGRDLHPCGARVTATA